MATWLKIKTKNYLKIGLAISLIAHVGIFALGGYIMDNLTKQTDEIDPSATTEDIIYFEADDIKAEESADISAQAEPEIIIHDDKITPKTEEITPDVLNEQALPKNMTQEITPKTDKLIASDTKAKAKPKLRKLSDLKNIKIGKIPTSPLKEQDISKLTSKDLQPTLIYKAKPEYDHSLIPADEEIHIVIAYVLDDNGTPIQAEIIRPTDSTQITGMTAEALEDLKTATIEALQKSKIKPAKDKEARHTPQQIQFTLTPNGSIDITAY